LISGRNPESYAEEVISVKGFGTFYNFREVFSFVSDKFRKRFKIKRKENSLIDSRCFRLDDLDCECEAQTIYQSSAIDGSDVAAQDVDLYINKKYVVAFDCRDAFGSVSYQLLNINFKNLGIPTRLGMSGQKVNSCTCSQHSFMFFMNPFCSLQTIPSPFFDFSL
jgi:hypothetical protein